MPPKKDAKAEEKIKLGRPGNTLKMGIVGLPNVGKSTTFNLLSRLNVPAENYPFCTIDPNLAKVPVPDARFDKLCEMWKPKSQVPATLSILDIAGLVPGAHKGEGLGNAFLSHIREVDGIYHVVRAFDDQEIVHTEMEVDPVRDLDIISKELVYKDLDYCTKRIDELESKIKRFNTKEDHEEKNALDKVKTVLEQFKWIRLSDWTMNEVEILNKHLFITSKPAIYLVNLSVQDYLNKKNKWLGKIKQWIDANVPGEIIPYSAAQEAEVLDAELTKNEESKENIKMTDDKGQPSMINRIIRTGYKALDLIYFFTAGEDEVRCWTIREGTKSPQAAGVIHTDFEKGFICNEVMKQDDFARLGSETAVKAEGKYRQQGKEQVVEDGDICQFKAGKLSK